MYYYKLNELQDITKIINNSNALLTSLQEANRRFENLDLIYSPVRGNTIDTKDSLEIATYFSKNLFKDNKDLVLQVYRAFKNMKGIEDSNKKYYYQKVVVADTIGSKIIKSDYYKVNLSVVLPDNNVHYIKYFIKADNLSKFAAIEM